MTKEQERLVAAFESLPEDRQSVLELLSAAYHPRSRTAALELVNAAGALQSPTGAKLVFASWKPIVAELLSRRLLVEVGNHIDCNPVVKESMMWNAARTGRLQRWLSATATLRPVFRHGDFDAYRQHDAATVFRGVRNSLHRNNALAFLRFWRAWHELPSWKVEGIDILAKLFNNPFHADWVHSRAPGIRDIVLPKLIAPLLDSLQAAEEQIGVARRILDDGEGKPELGDLVAEYLLLAGDIAGAERLLADGRTWMADALRGWAACVSGRRDEAVNHFEKAIKLNRKQTRRRLVHLPSRIGAIYVMSLIGSTGRTRIAKAHRYLDLAIRKRPKDELPLYQVLKGAAFFAEGKADAARERAASIVTTSRTPPVARVLAHAALCSIDPKMAREAHSDLGTVPADAVRNGYLWVALEASRVRRAVVKNAKEIGGRPVSKLARSCSPLLEHFSDQPAWERTLEALANLTEQDAAGFGGQGHQSRLVWRIGGSGFLAPFHQSLSKKGTWTKGRGVALRRLYEENYDGPLTPNDQRICSAIVAESVGYYGAKEYYFDLDRALPPLIGHPCVFRSDDPSVKVEVVSSEPSLRVVTRKREVLLNVEPKPPEEGDTTVRFESPSRLAISVFGPKHRSILEIIGRNGLRVPLSAKPGVIRAISGASKVLAVNSDIDSGRAEAAEVTADASPRFNMTPYGDGLRVEPRVLPLKEGGPSFRPGKGGSAVFATVAGRAVRTSRNLGEEEKRFRAVTSSCPTLDEASWDGSGWILESPASCLELLDELHRIRDEATVAWPRGESMRITARAKSSRLSLKIRAARDWFEIGGTVQTDEGLVLDLLAALSSLKEANGRFIPIGDGEFLALSDRFHRRIQKLGILSARGGKGLRFHRSRAHLLQPLAEVAGSVDAGTKWKAHLRRFRKAEALDPLVPSTLRAQLRDYQAQGFRWALRLAAWGGGACLADDMGLGKTVQALAVALARAKGGPALVVAPTSVCLNWIDEARRFAPTLRALRFGQGDREAMLKGVSAHDVVVCSYGLLRQEQDLLAAVQWETVVLDEAQAIKNRETQVSKAAMRLSAGFRLIATGTPVENHLGEVWNLFHFLNPGLLGSATWFNHEFATPIHQHGSLTKRSQLKRLIRPFVLRRTKSAVLDELPARTEITVRIEMSDEERALYEAVRQQALASVGEDDGTVGSKHLRILAEIMKLRRACCHPELVVPDSGIASSKLSKFIETVSELKDSAHKALVFSQFVGHLAIIRSHLDRLGVRYRYLDGSTPPARRKQEVERFQNGDGDLFLISLRAGGQGLNLTAADYVIHLDPWWNPAVEDQASDRAHRIGQTRPVTIYRLVMRDTIEESILDLHRSKRDLADSLLEGTDVSGKLSADELLALIREG